MAQIKHIKDSIHHMTDLAFHSSDDRILFMSHIVDFDSLFEYSLYSNEWNYYFIRIYKLL